MGELAGWLGAYFEDMRTGWHEGWMGPEPDSGG